MQLFSNDFFQINTYKNKTMKFYKYIYIFYFITVSSNYVITLLTSFQGIIVNAWNSYYCIATGNKIKLVCTEYIQEQDQAIEDRAWTEVDDCTVCYEKNSCLKIKSVQIIDQFTIGDQMNYRSAVFSPNNIFCVTLET